MTDTKIKIGEWEFNTATHELTSGERRLTLENRQAQLLVFLADNAGRDVSKDELLELWRPRVVNEDALYVCVANLRKALGDEPRSPRYIKTLPGFGYRLLADVTPAEGKSGKGNGLRSYGFMALIAGVLVAFILFWPSPKPVATTIPSRAVADDYQRARYLLSQGEAHDAAAISLLRNIMLAAPTFADAFALAAYQQTNALFGAAEHTPGIAEANAWADHALRLDPDHQLAHLAKANLLFSIFWDWDQAREHYERALGSADSYFHYAQFMLALREFESALAYSYQYQDLDPKGYSRASVAWIRAMAGNYSSALEVLDQLYMLEPDNAYYHVCRQMIFQHSGEHDKAYDELHWLMTHAGYDRSDLERVGAARQQGGLSGVYSWLLNQDQKHLNLGQYDPPLSLARYAIGAGDYETALAYLRQAVEQRQVEVLWLAADPVYRPLYNYAEFADLLRQIGLKPGIITSK